MTAAIGVAMLLLALILYAVRRRGILSDRFIGELANIVTVVTFVGGAALLILGNLAPPSSLEAPEVPSPSSHEQGVGASTAPAPTPSQQETAVAVTSPTASEVEAEFADGCIPVSRWAIYTLGPPIEPSNTGCWPVQFVSDEWGMYGKDKGLLISVNADSAELSHAIFNTFEGDAIIRFQIRIEEIVAPSPGMWVNIAFGMISTNPVTPLAKGLFYQKESPDFPILLKQTATGTEDAYLTQNGRRLEIQPGASQEVTVSIRGPDLTIAVDAQPILEIARIPAASRAFWIGYKVPLGGRLKVWLSDFSIRAP